MPPIILNQLSVLISIVAMSGVFVHDSQIGNVAIVATCDPVAITKENQMLPHVATSAHHFHI